MERKLTDTSVFKTDVRQVFDLIRCSGDKEKLGELVNGNDYYKNMEEDAYDVAVNYTNSTQLIGKKDYYREEGGKINMCKAIDDLIEDGRIEGREEGRTEGIEIGITQKTQTIVYNMLLLNKPMEEICAIAECNEDFVKSVAQQSLYI